MGRDINRMTEMVRVVLGSGDAGNGYRDVTVRLRVRWKLARTITFDQVKEILLQKWTSTTGIDTMDVIHSLENYGVLRQSKKDTWKILLEREVPQPNYSITPWRVPKPQKPELKTKPGICPKCGKKVQYANRHQRAGSAHTGDECRLNQIGDVMNE